MLILVNKKSLMGAKRNKRAYNIVAWTLTALATILTVFMLVGTIRGS
jgi:Mn2+/Fe2+ NRAMP family transporter